MNSILAAAIGGAIGGALGAPLGGLIARAFPESLDGWFKLRSALG